MMGLAGNQPGAGGILPPAGQTQKKSRQVALAAFALVWWSWRELNPRPQAFYEQFYMFSGLF